jgi:1,2-diacylglycerol 3-alpha-glucosyltransferase
VRILIEGTTYHPSLNGQAIFMVNLAEGLAARGHEVMVLYPDRREFSRRLNGVQVEAMGSISLGAIHTESYWPVFFRRKVRRLFDSFRPEIVHVHDHYPLSVGVVHEAKWRGIKVLGTNHYSPASLEPYIPGASIFKPVLDWILWEWMLRLFRRMDYVTAPSPAAVNLLRARGLHVPGTAISCGTDLKRFHPDPSIDRAACRAQYGLDPRRTIFLYVGRVDQEKRIDVLLQAIQRTTHPDLQLGIAGSGAALNELTAVAEMLHLDNRVQFLGAVPNDELNRLLNSVDIFAMAGEAESLSIASLEAMACGLPVLLADAFALPELVTQGVNGYLFKSGDPGDAARYMELLASQPERWKEMGRASAESVKAHSLETTLERYEALYVQTRTSTPGAQTPALEPTRKRDTEVAQPGGHP